MENRWFRFLSSHEYRHGTTVERRLIELRVSAALAVVRRRRLLRITQRQLAALMRSTQARVSKMEQLSANSFDPYVLALVVMDTSDDDLARAFNPLECHAARTLRQRAALPYFPPARPEQPG
ncbi:MAG TPA: hypothetical protein VK864_03285 [Longimicrobiales bacterium]|nr:hypothetical protein [Longimicrobiales bacterium]